MISDTFSTHSLPARDQLQAWRAWFEPVFEVAPHPSTDGSFGAETTIWSARGFGMSRVSAPGLRAVRTRAMIRRNPVDHWVITIGHGAETAIETQHSTLQVAAGTPFVLSLGDELVSERNEDQRLQAYLARDAFAGIAPHLDAARGTSLATPLGRLLGEYLILLERTFPDLAREDMARLNGAVRAMVAACVASSPDRLAEASALIDLSRMERVRRIVGRHLHSPALDAEMLCVESGMSRSLLYRVLESEGGVSRYIRRRRLEAAYAALSDASRARPIAAIAGAFCFVDASSFSRAFRQEFGMRPTDVPAASSEGLMPSRGQIQSHTRKLLDCLRAF